MTLDDQPVDLAHEPARQLAATLAGLVERLAPDAGVLAALANREPSRELFADYLRDIVRALTENRDVTMALFELRLKSTRRPEVAAMMSEWGRSAFETDVAFNTAAGLPSGAREIALFHYAVDGLLLDRLTTPLMPDTSTDEIVDALVAGLPPR